MKKLFLIFCVCVLVGCVPAEESEVNDHVVSQGVDNPVEVEEYVRVPTIGKKIPQFDGLLGSDGALHNLSDFEGAPLLLLFETTQCHYCELERPGWIELAQEYPYLQIVTIATGEEMPQVKQLIDREKIPYLWLLEGDQFISVTYMVYGTPDHFLVDADGILRARHKGYLTKDKLEAALHEHIFFSQHEA